MNATSLSLMLLVCFLTPIPPLAGAAACPAEEQVVLAKIKALQDRNNPDRDRILRELREFGPRARAAIPALMDVLQKEPDLRDEAAWTLGEIGAAAVPLLIKTLDDPDKAVRLAAIFGLQGAGENARPAVPILVKLLRVKDAEVRIQVMGALGSIPCPESALALGNELVREPDYGIRWHAADSLTQLGPAAEPAAPALVKVLRELNTLQKMDPLPDVLDSGTRGWRHPVPDLSMRVGRALKSIGAGAVPTLTELLKDPDKDLRCRALVLLTDIGPEARRSVPAVLKCLEDKEPEVRRWAAGALSYLGPDALFALPALRKLLRDRSTEVRIEAAGTILRLKPPSEEALGVLLDGIRDRESDRRLQAIAAIQWLGLIEKRVVGALLATVKGDADELVRSRARTCMEKLAPPAAWVVPVLDTWLGDRSEEVRATAAWQLATVTDPQLAVPSLLRALRDPSAQVRAYAAEALGSHGKGAVAALPTLTKVSQDDLDIHVRYKAACAVAKIERSQEERKPKGEDPASDPPSGQKED